MTERFPTGWIATTLGHIRLDLSQSVNPSKMPGQMFELYSVPSFTEQQPEIVAGNAIGSAKRTIETNTVLLCKINPRINRVWVVGDYSPYRKIASTEWLSFASIDGLLPHYLCYYLQQDAFRDHLAANASGVGGSLMRVRGTTFSGYHFPLPPLPEQHRIVAEIEKQFTRLDASVAALKCARANLRRYRASVLKAACTGMLVPTEAELAQAEGRDYEPGDQLLARILSERRVRWEAQEKRGRKYGEPVAPDTANLPNLPEGWVWATVEQVAAVQGGIQKQPKRTPADNPFPFLRVANVLRGSLDLKEVHEIELFPGELDRLRLTCQDLLIVEGNGSPSQIGRMAIWNGAIEDCVHQNHIIRVRTADGIAPQYIETYWNSPDGSSRVNGEASSTSGLYTLSVSKVSGLPIPLPPLAEQRRIVAELERRLSVIQQAEETVEASLKRAERLRQSILKQAFSGHLVPQDPNDEPASLLLERIRAQREAIRTVMANSRKPRRPRSRPSPEGQLLLSEDSP